MQNLEFVQLSLFEREERDPSCTTIHQPLRASIRELQAVIAEKQEQFETEADAAIQAPTAVTAELPSPNSDPEKTLSTQEHILQNHREAQDSMSDDLLVMARNLRDAQEAFGRAVAADNDLIDNTGEALQKNSESMKRTGNKLSQYSRQSSWSCWYTLITVVVALVAFMMTYVLILLT